MNIHAIVAISLVVLFGCEAQEIVRENEIPATVLQSRNYLGRLPRDPKRMKTGMFYYNTKTLNFRICKMTPLWIGKSVTMIPKWQYIQLATLVKSIEGDTHL